MAAFLFLGVKLPSNPSVTTTQPNNPRRIAKMEAPLKAYAWFVGFTLITAIVVRPIAVQMNIPILKDL